MEKTKQAENIFPENDQVRDSVRESHFDNSLEGLAYCQMLYDAQGHPRDFVFIQVNKSFVRMTGLTDLAGKRVTDLNPAINITYPKLLDICGRVSLTGKPEIHEMYIDNVSRWFLVSIYSPEKNYFVAAFQDINDRKQVEKDLENSKIAARNILEDLHDEKEKLAQAMAKDEALLQSIGDGVIATDRDGRVILINPMAEHLLGFKSSELIGKILEREVVLLDGQGKKIPDNLRPITLALSAGANKTTLAITHTDFQLVRKNGTKFASAFTVTPVILDLKMIGGVVVFRDITKEKEIEHAKSEFISIASHQLRTPVSGLSWLVEALEEGDKDMLPKQKKYIKDLSILTKRLVALIEDLLNFSRIELKTEVMTEKDQIEVHKFIEEFIKEMKPYADSKKHKIDFKSHIAKNLLIEINKKSFYNVLQNLLSNAIDYSPLNSTVAVNLARTDDSIKISISNTGPAIPKDDQPKIFNRFYRAEGAKKMKAEGTGLGLYIAKAIIEGIGGTIGFESEEGEDTVFWFTIPVKESKQ